MGSVSKIIEKTRDETKLSTKDPFVASVKASPAARRFVRDGLNYTVRSEFLIPPENCRKTLTTAFIATYGLSRCAFGSTTEQTTEG